MSQEEAMGVYNAIGQWADNQRNFVEENEDCTFDDLVTPAIRQQLAAVEAVVEACEGEIAAAVERAAA
jgi:hypothetical protein